MASRKTDETVMAVTSLSHSFRVIPRGAKLSSDDEVVRRNPGHFVREGAPDSEVQEALVRLHAASRARQPDPSILAEAQERERGAKSKRWERAAQNVSWGFVKT